MDGLVTECCPVLWIDEFATVIRTHIYLEKGILPHAGGWAEQPAVLMQLAETFKANITR